ncbi:SDR family NAD(P)-dependent oxidoreductase, partial [Schumannella luteola]
MTDTASTSASATSDRSQFTFTDPTKLYADIDTPEQYQEGAGLDRDLVQKADLGEQSYRGSGRLTGRKALITGGDSGIGAATAIAFAREGADVAISYLPEEQPDAERIAGLIRDAGRVAVTIPGDIKDLEFCRELVERTVAQLGGLDILINNA